ncbi:dTDP-4-dehydrorhamnose reductase [Rossellomorea marisflavi]|uniref:dTDP-4-dehydrorhamnose reductase n=1 Tax=Rossellomorea marisflavi TaxID=189381 RepID=A0A0M0FZA5_9BACI|nr:dTDP-4-dehydrorhamnose reductase [Rossellomorea marisflavi]KON82890.1 dTDP-4-dehydrorhamnose reductase [Rossellomorea marisflavi]
MKVLVTGYTGQLGYDVVKYGSENGINIKGLGSEDLNITSEVAVNKYVKKFNPEVIIHCAAYTAVDKAEDNKDKCWNVNVEGTKHLAKIAREIDAKFVYISTDYVFNGEGEKPFKETDNVSPIGYYGLTKYEGEKIVKQVLDKYFIIRISWVFGLNGNNFVKTMLRLADIKKELSVVGDQVGSPTYTYDLAKLIIEMVQSDKYGIYHASNEGYCSWAEFAQEIFAQADANVSVNSIITEEYPTRAVRPKNSRMSKEKLSTNGFTPLPKWQDALKHYLTELKHEVK